MMSSSTITSSLPFRGTEAKNAGPVVSLSSTTVRLGVNKGRVHVNNSTNTTPTPGNDDMKNFDQSLQKIATNFPSTTQSNSITTVANENRRLRLQRAANIFPGKGPVTEPSQQLEKKSGTVVDESRSRNDLGFRQVRSSPLSRRLVGFEPPGNGSAGITLSENKSVSRESSIDSTKDSTSYSSQSQNSQGPKAYAGMGHRTRLYPLHVRQVTKNVEEPNIHQNSQLMDSAQARSKSLDHVSASATVNQYADSNGSSSYTNTNTDRKFSQTHSTTATSVTSADGDPSKQLNQPNALDLRRRPLNFNNTASVRLSEESKRVDQQSSSTSRSIASNRAFQQGLARRRNTQGKVSNGSSPPALKDDKFSSFDYSHQVHAPQQEQQRVDEMQTNLSSMNVPTSHPDIVMSQQGSGEPNQYETNAQTGNAYQQAATSQFPPYRTQRLSSPYRQQIPVHQEITVKHNSIFQPELSSIGYVPEPLENNDIRQPVQSTHQPDRQLPVNARAPMNSLLVGQSKSSDYPDTMMNAPVSVRQQNHNTGSRYPVPVSPTLSRLLEASPKSTYASLSRSHGAISSEEHMPMNQGRARSPHSHTQVTKSVGSHISQRVRNTPTFSPNGSAPNHASQISIENRPSLRIPYHNDDEVTLTSVRQIVGSEHEKPRRKSSTKIHSSSTYDSNPNRNKREKFGQRNQSRRLATTASSDFETDQDESTDERSTNLYGENVLKEPSLSLMSASQMTPDVGTFFDHENTQRKNNVPKDDETYDYGDRDDDSQGSISYVERRKKEEREKSARRAAAAAAKAEMEGPFIKTDDVVHYRKTLDTPLSRTALGLTGAATIGCIILGPVGVLVGAAAVGIGVGYMQIPEEQRLKMNDKALDALKTAQESTVTYSEKLSYTCATTYDNSGIDEHIPQEAKTCCAGLTSMDNPERVNEDEKSAFDGNGPLEETTGEAAFNKHSSFRSNISPSQQNRLRDKNARVACLKEGKIIPLGQIHSLDPVLQPKAWLDVLTSAETTQDEKVEALEEIVIMAKDKQRTRIFVEEGILDSLMWTLGLYFIKMSYDPSGPVKWVNSEITKEEESFAKRAAVCCLTLGKSYCAAIHTEGDLLLMSLYERGSVPEDRQLAQMLYEVPHHSRATRTDDPTIIIPNQEIFSIKQMTLPQAEELAVKIKDLASSVR